MVTKTITIHVFFDGLLKIMHYQEASNRKTVDLDIATVGLIAAQYFSGNMDKSLCFVRSTGLMPDMPGKSRFNRRLHQIGELLSGLFFHTGQAEKELTLQSVYSIDNSPVPVCHNTRRIYFYRRK